jgi:hypothetical protein
MTITFNYAGAPLIGVRAPGGSEPAWQFVEAADRGDAAMSGFNLDDTASSWAMVGLKDIYAEESLATPHRFFMGYMADRSIGRGAALLTGADRQWQCNVVDLNSRLSDVIIKSTGSKRPAESDTARLNWLKGYLTSAWFSTGSLYSPGGTSLDAADYYGRTPHDVLADASNESNYTFYLYWDGTKICLAYHPVVWSGNTAAASISNVFGAANGSTVFAPAAGDRLVRDPQRVYSGCLFEYAGGRVYVTNPTTASNFRQREIRATDMTVGKPASAKRLATAYLARCATEEDHMTVHLANVPPASLGKMRPGQRISVRLSEVDGYTAGTYMAIIRRGVGPVAGGLYDVTLELRNPILTGFWGVGHKQGILNPSTRALNVGLSTAQAASGQASNPIVNSQMTVAAPGVLTGGTSVTDEAGQNDELPWYTVVNNAGAPTLTVVEDPLWPGENYILVQFNALSDSAIIATDAFPVGANQALQLIVTQAALVKDGSTLQRGFSVDWLAGDGTTVISNSTIADDTFAEAGADYTLPQTTAQIGSPIIAPANASFGRLIVTLTETAGHNAANYWEWGGFKLLQLSSGQVLATTITASGAVEFMSTVSLDKTAVMTLQAGVQPPLAAPTLSQGLAAPLSLAATPGWVDVQPGAGFYDPVGGVSGATPCYVQVQGNGSTFRVAEWTLATGALNRTTTLGAWGGGGTLLGILGITRIGTSWYLTVQNDSAPDFLAVVTRATGAFSAYLNISARFYSDSGGLPIATDGSNLFVMGLATSALTGRVVKFSTVPAYTSTQALTLPTAPGGAGLVSFADFAIADDGDGAGTTWWADIYWDNSTAYNVYQFTIATGAVVAGTSWPGMSFGSGLYPMGLIWDGANFREFDGVYQTLQTYSNLAGGKAWLSYAWYDDVGTAHETSVSPRASITMVARRNLSITTAAIPVGGADDPDKVRVYMVYGSTDPGPTHYHLQTTDALTNRTLTGYNVAGAADGGGTAFPGGTGAEIKSALATTDLKGDGTVIIGGITVAAAGVPNHAPTAVTSFSGSWVNYGGATRAAAYWKDDHGVVHLQGVIKSGTINTAAFTLPVGFRPSGTAYFSCPANNAFGALNITSAGVVTPAAGSTTWFALDGVTFEADN